MSRETFQHRGQALEDEFFHRVDQKLAEKLQQQRQHEKDVQTLQQTTGISEEAVIEELFAAGITPATLKVMNLVPAVHVAWANGYVENKERSAVMHAASGLGISAESESGQLLNAWLHRKPSPELWTAWRDYIRALHSVVAPKSFEALKNDAVRTAQNIASSAGGFLGIHTISDKEQRAIQQVTDAFDDAKR